MVYSPSEEMLVERGGIVRDIWILERKGELEDDSIG